MEKKIGGLKMAIMLARAVLRIRETRRKLIFYTIVAVLVVFALGNWPLSGWLEDSALRFVFYWAGCAFLAIFLFLLGLYDFLAVLKEHRDYKERL